MFALSTRVKEAFKTALAMAIVYGISLGMGWENPYWAGFAVAMISLSTVGQSLNKGVMRMLGTLVAAVAALTLIAWFAQERWWFVAILSLYLGFCTYMFTGKQRTYFWWCCAFVCLVISTHAANDLPDAFDIAVLRVQQTAMGILVYTLVSVFLWPSNTRGSLEEATRKLFTTQAKLYRSYHRLLSGQGAAEGARPLRMQEVQLLNQREQALRGAVTDCYEVWELRRQWWRLHRLSTALMETLEHWRESFPEIQGLEQSRLLPNQKDIHTELDRRFQEIERMLAGKSPTRSPQPVTPVIDEAAENALTHFQKAAVAVAKFELERLELLSRSLFDCVMDIKGYGQQDSSSLAEDPPTGGRAGLDPDRLQASLRAVAATWAAFLVWFWVDPPGHSSFVEVAIIFVMISAMIRVDPATIVKPMIAGSLVAGVLYIFVMPHLSGYAQLSALIFGATFAIYYLLWQPSQAMAKSALVVQFLNIIGVQNQQTYDFSAYANTVAAIALAGGLAIAITYLPPSPRPEKVFLRLLARFFRHSEYLLSRLALDWKQTRGIIDRCKTLLYSANLLELSQTLAMWGGKIDHRIFPGNSPEQIQALTTELNALALRIKALAETREVPQADLLVRELLDDVRAWRLLIQGQFGVWADKPEEAVAPGVDAEERLRARLKRLETRVDETFDLASEGELSARDYENFYRLLGSYRGLSETGINYLRQAENINWTQWREARF